MIALVTAESVNDTNLAHAAYVALESFHAKFSAARSTMPADTELADMSRRGWQNFAADLREDSTVASTVRGARVNKFFKLRPDDPLLSPTGATLTTGSIARLASAMAHTLAKQDALGERLAGLNAKLDQLRADMAAFKAHRANEESAKAASDEFRKAHQ
jgi:hypothetical protein